MARKIYYLIKELIGQPSKNCMAETYVDKEIKLDPGILDSLSRIVEILKNVEINDDGQIAHLTRINGNTYCLIVKDYVNPVTQQRIRYQVIKKINLCQHVYEIRFLSNVDNQLRNCRIFFTINRKKNYIVWTHGFTKIRNKNLYFGKSANEATNLFAKLAELLFKIINNLNYQFKCNN